MLWAALAPGPAFAATTLSGDSQIFGQIGVGTELPRARLDVRLSSSDVYGLMVSSANGLPMMALNAQGRLGVGISSPSAALDVHGSADDGDLGMLLRVGNSTSSTSS